jgi:hypothetical protein
MGTVTAYDGQAEWSTTACGRRYRFIVRRFLGHRLDEDSKVPWSWELIAVNYDKGGDVEVVSSPTMGDHIWAPAHSDARTVLASLAGFMNAWLEALASADRDSENLHLFPIEAVRMLGAVEEFYLDTHEAAV